MKNKMPLDGLGLGHDSGSVHCDMLKMLCFRTAWGGVIFISIGSDELVQLTLLCNEIFCEQNQLAIIPRVQKKGNGKGTHFSPSVDYVLVYCNSKSDVSRFFSPFLNKTKHGNSALQSFSLAYSSKVIE